MGIVGHTLVKNEQEFIWYAITSVIDHLDGLMVWDNGSTDATIKIIRSIESPKIKFRDASGLSPERARQKMLEETESDWIFVLDGDEIWYDGVISSIRQLTTVIKEDLIVVPNYM